MTKILPSRLKALFFTKIYVEAVQQEEAGAGVLTSESIQYKKDSYKNSENEFVYSIEIKTKSLDATDRELRIPYVFSVEAVAVFVQDYEAAEGEAARVKYFADQAGYTALIGAIREIIASYTARGPWGSVMLPLIPIQALAGPYPKQIPDMPAKIEESQKKISKPRKTTK